MAIKKRVVKKKVAKKRVAKKAITRNPVARKKAGKKPIAKKKANKKRVQTNTQKAGTRKRVHTPVKESFTVEIKKGNNTYYFDGIAGDTSKVKAAQFTSKVQANKIAQILADKLGSKGKVYVNGSTQKTGTGKKK